MSLIVSGGYASSRIPNPGPITQIQPFTYEDGVTFTELLADIRRYIVRVLEPYLKELGLDVDAKIEALIKSVDDALDAQTADVEARLDAQDAEVDAKLEAQDAANTAAILALTTYVNEQVEAIINDSIQVQDPVVAGIVGDETSATRGAMDTVYRDVILVKDPQFGAKGDGVTDDTAAINAAVDYAHSIGGGKVGLVDGTFMVNADAGSSVWNNAGGVNLKDGVTLWIAGDAVLKALPVTTTVSKIVRAYNAKRVSILGPGVIDGNRDNAVVTTGEWGYGISVNAGEDITIRDVKAVNCWGDGINIQRLSAADITPPKNVLIDNVVCDNNRRQGCSVESAEGLEITNSVFSNTNGTLPTAGLDIEPADGVGTVNDVVVNSNKFLNNDRMGFVSGESVNIHNITFENNTLIDNGGLDNTPQIRVIVGGNGFKILNNRTRVTHGAVACYVAGCRTGLVVDDNQFDKDLRVTGTAIITGFPVGTRVRGNTIEGGSIVFDYQNYFTIADNYIVPAAGRVAIELGPVSVSYGKISGNDVVGGSNAVAFGTATIHNEIEIAGNTFVHTTDAAMWLKGGTNINIHHNTFHGCCLSSSDTVIFDAVDGNGAARRRIEQNVFRRDPRAGTTPTNVPLYAYRCEAVLLESTMQNNRFVNSLLAFPTDQAAGAGTFLATTASTPARASTLRPTNAPPGFMFYDTTLNKPIWRNAAAGGWVDSAGAAVV